MVVSHYKHDIVKHNYLLDAPARLKTVECGFDKAGLLLQISLGLHKLLGKSVSVGGDNLTWTLLKYIKCDADDHDGYDTEALTENYSKLNVALSVMHECFEPVKEPGTRRDLVEDVIFSRW